jgi:hypothetical protein
VHFRQRKKLTRQKRANAGALVLLGGTGIGVGIRQTFLSAQPKTPALSLSDWEEFIATNPSRLLDLVLVCRIHRHVLEARESCPLAQTLLISEPSPSFDRGEFPRICWNQTVDAGILYFVCTCRFLNPVGNRLKALTQQRFPPWFNQPQTSKEDSPDSRWNASK